MILRMKNRKTTEFVVGHALTSGRRRRMPGLTRR